MIMTDKKVSLEVTEEEVYRIKDEINQAIMGMTADEIIEYYNKSGEEFDRQMAEYKKQKEAEKLKNKIAINQ